MPDLDDEPSITEDPDLPLHQRVLLIDPRILAADTDAANDLMRVYIEGLLELEDEFWFGIAQPSDLIA